ncbi:MAG: hypothetical protein U0229_03605 [Anaeromyxobacter sp.]
MRPPVVALVLAVAAAFSAWNPLAAPFGLVVGLVAAVLSVRAVRGPRLRWAAWAALALSSVAAAGAAVVLARTAGVGRGPAGAEVVPAPPPAEVSKGLDDAAAATRDARERAARELPAPAGPPAGAAPGPGAPSGKR